MGRVTSQEIELMLDEQSAKAKALGVSGSPSFEVSGEAFCGDARLDYALKWAIRGTSQAT